MSSQKKTVFTIMAVLLLVGLAFLQAAPVSAASVDPIFVDGNPTCTDLGYAYEYKVDSPNAGTYTVSGVGTVTIMTTDGVYFDWTSTFGIDAVIAKGGSNANVYVYDPPAESFGDTGLHSPINASNGKPSGLSHISFCYDLNVTVTKTANTTFTRTYHWDINKSVTPATWNLFTGDSGTSEYTVSVDKTGYTDSNWAVSGEILIKNNTPSAATITAVSDALSGVGAVAVDCGVNFPYTLPAGDDLTCTYSTALPDGTNRTNTATVTTSGIVGGGSGTADVTFGAPTTVVNDAITVSDTNGMSWGPVSDDTSWSYPKTFTCDADEGAHDNTATIVETGQSASATVTVNCYALTVTKNAVTALTRTYDWTITKTGDQTSLTLAIGQQYLVKYTVVVNATSSDSAWSVSGNIDVHNPAPIDATLNGVADIVSPAIAASVDCGVTFPYMLPAGETLACTYSATLPDANDRTNTATATLQNYSYDDQMSGTVNGTTDFSGTAAVSFTNATITKVDECINVSDTHAGFLGTVCADDAPKPFHYIFHYMLTVGPYAECGTYTFVNVASFVTNDTGATDSDDHTVTVTVPCPGCTLTQGYWKTHSDRGPAPYDDAWKNVGALEEDTPFFLSGQTWYQVFWTAPAGNVYYNLAQQYMAAKLNIGNGAASTPAVDQAIIDAEALFAENTPTEAAALKGAAKKTWTDLASLLDQYNNGLIGPGHCSEAANGSGLGVVDGVTTIFLPTIAKR